MSRPVLLQSSSSSSSSGTASVASSGSSGFKLPKAKGLNRGTWFGAPSFASSSKSSSTTSAPSPAMTTTFASTAASPSANPFALPHGGPSFVPSFASSRGKHRLSPSPSPSAKANAEEDFVMISPVRSNPFMQAVQQLNLDSKRMVEMQSGSSSSPLEESPTPACGVASATARLKLVDDDSPIRRVPGQSRSLKAGPDGEDRSIFLSTDNRRTQPPSPLKFSTTNLMPLADGEESPQLPETPLFGSGPAPPPQPLFPAMRTSRSQGCDASSSQPKTLFTTDDSKSRSDESRIPRLSTSQPIRARASTQTERPLLGQKKAISLDALPTTSEKDETFGPPSAFAHGRKLRPASGTAGAIGLAREGRAHKRINSGDYYNLPSYSISRSFGQKSGLALSLSPGSLGPLPDFSYSNSSLSSLSTAHLTPPASAFSPAEPPIFENVKPLQAAFENTTGTVSRKFKPRDSGVSLGDDDKPATKIPPASVMQINPTARPRRPAMLKRTSSMGDGRPECETPLLGPSGGSGWPGQAFGFLGESGAGLGFRREEEKPSMPGTPVKKHAFAGNHAGHPIGSARGHRVGHSLSVPSMGSTDTFAPVAEESLLPTRPGLGVSSRSFNPPPTSRKPGPGGSIVHTSHIGMAKTPHDFHLTLTTSSSPDSPSAMDTDPCSPTVMKGPGAQAGCPKGLLGVHKTVQKPTRIGLLRRLSSGNGSTEGSEDECTPTKGGGERMSLGQGDQATPTPCPTPKLPLALGARPNNGITANVSIMPRLSLPAFANPKVHRTLQHRQSHPAPASSQAEEDVFEKRFITLETVGKGAFSTVVKVQERYGEGLYAVKKARGMFDGVKDRLRHLEEVDILRHLSVKPSPHVIRFVDAWEQNRQLFIQTELCLGSLAFFLEEYGRVVERLDEGRVWKIVRELSDGIHHIHSAGVIHFDIKPANILISPTGSLKLGDFGLATRWPRVKPIQILKGSGLGGSVVMVDSSEGKLEREGDRVYMPPETLRGVFVQAADVFSFGLVLLEVSTNICVPDGGPAWHALRNDDFTVVDLSCLSPALVDLITQCMRSDFAYRPKIEHVVEHPVVQRARNGKEALAPEERGWLVDVLAGGSGFTPAPTALHHGGVIDGDVVMDEA